MSDKKNKPVSKKNVKEESSSDSSSSDEETTTTTKPTATATTTKKPTTTPKKKDDSSSEDSSSEEEAAPAKPVAKAAAKPAAKPAKAAKQEPAVKPAVKNGAKPAAKADDSSSEDSSSEEEEKPEAKKPAPTKAAATAPAKATPPAKTAAKAATEEDSSSESSSEDEAPKPAAKATTAVKATTPAAKATNGSAKKGAESSSEDSEQDSDEEEKEKMEVDNKNKKRKAEEPATDIKKTKVITPEKPAPTTNGDQEEPEHKVFIGNLSFNIDEATVKETFADCGEIVDIFFLMDKASNRFKGTGFVSFAAQESLQKALAHNGESVMGRDIRVEIASPRPGPRRTGPSPGRTPQGTNPPSRTVFLGNLPYDVNDDQVKTAFKDCGEIDSIRWVTNRETGEFRCCGFIDFDSEDSATKAVALNGSLDLGGKSIRVDFAGEKKEKPEGGGRGGGRGGRGGGRGGRGGAPRAIVSEAQGKRITFD